MTRQLWDSSILRKITAKEVDERLIPTGSTIAVAPIVIVETLTGLNSENIASRRAACLELLRRDIEILALPRTHVMYLMERASSEAYVAETGHFIKIVERFARGEDFEPKLPEGMNFSDYRRLLEDNLENTLSRQRIIFNPERKAKGKFELNYEVERLLPRWLIIMPYAKLVFGSIDGGLKLSEIDTLVNSLEIYADILNYYIYGEYQRTGAFDRHDLGDITQLLYLQSDTFLFTDDRKWITLSKEAGHKNSVKCP